MPVGTTAVEYPGLAGYSALQQTASDAGSMFMGIVTMGTMLKTYHCTLIHSVPPLQLCRLNLWYQP